MNHICDYPDSHIVRTFDIAAISLPIVYNKYGDHDPNGLLYVLKEDAERIQREARERFRISPPQPYEEVQPLVLRANVGDEIRVVPCLIIAVDPDVERLRNSQGLFLNGGRKRIVYFLFP